MLGKVVPPKFYQDNEYNLEHSPQVSRGAIIFFGWLSKIIAFPAFRVHVRKTGLKVGFYRVEDGHVSFRGQV